MEALLRRVIGFQLARQIKGSHLRARLIRGIGGTFALRTFSIALRFVTIIVLARWLGAQHLGIYNFAMAWVTFLIAPALFGLDRLNVRDLSIYRTRSDWAHLRGLLKFGSRFVFVASLLLMLAGGALAWITYHTTGRPALLNIELADFARVALYTLLIALLSLPLRSLLLLQQASIQGLHHVVTAQVPEQVIQPALFLLLMGGVYLVGDRYASSQYAMALQALSVAAALAVSMRLLRRAIPRGAGGVEMTFEMRLWMVSAIPFAISKGLNILDQQMDVIMLGIMDSAKAVALYTVTQRGTQLISLLLMSVNIALAPNIAHFHADGKRDELQRMMTQTARLILFGALLIAAAFILWGRQFLALFGSEFTQAYTIVIILSIGQVVNAATGSAGLLLMMTDREREATLMMGLSVALHFVANLVFISAWGITGAAVAGAASVIVANLGMMWIAWRRLGIHTTALGDPAAWSVKA